MGPSSCETYGGALGHLQVTLADGLSVAPCRVTWLDVEGCRIHPTNQSGVVEHRDRGMPSNGFFLAIAEPHGLLLMGHSMGTTEVESPGRLPSLHLSR